MTLHKINYCDHLNRIRQGDIFSHVPYYRSYYEDRGVFELEVLEFPYVIVLTQDCDLEQNKKQQIIIEELKKQQSIIEENLKKNNYDSEQNKKEQKRIEDLKEKQLKNDKYLISLLVAPLYNAEDLFKGDHLSEIKIKSTSYLRNRKNGENEITKGKHVRYHYIEFEESVNIPNSVIDFKHYFSISLSYLEEHIKNRVCGINPLYRELISQRFANYLSRIGLPPFEKNNNC